MGILTALDAVEQATRLVDSMRLADELAFEATRDSGVRTIRVLASALSSDDQVVAIAATHALSGIFDEQANVAVSRLLSDERPFLREHAAWALGSRLPRFDAVGRLLGLVVQGDFAGMVAQRTLEQWSIAAPEPIAIGVEGALLGATDPHVRYRLVETLGLVRAPLSIDPLLRIATDASESERVRAAAIAGLGQRRGIEHVHARVAEWAELDGLVGDVARLALIDLTPGDVMPSEGLAIGQLFLHADIDAQLTFAGSGDNGGIATLLVRLGDALVAGGAPIDRVLTLSRGPAAAAAAGVETIGRARGHSYGAVPVLGDGGSAWSLRVAVRRGIRRMLRAAGGVDVLHLRMADVGSLAAADVARELDIPVVFTVAPDPHAIIDSLEKSGGLTRWNFGDVDEHEHFWFRARLVQQLAANADHTVLFPRPNLERDMLELVGIDLQAHPERHSIVPEGIDLEVIDTAVAEASDHAAGMPATAPIEALRALLASLPTERRGLPLVVSVGRFHRVKGMASIVKAWAEGPLAERANLLLVGGDLQQPSADERQQLEAIEAIVPTDERLARGLLLAGHRPNDITARWLAAARVGVPGLAAASGIYVCGSLKEEFGIALLEAMASGLFVVAPDAGGPATYVVDGVTGVLAPTWNVPRLGKAMLAALETAAAEPDGERAALSRHTVAESFTIQAMARALTGVYERVHAAQLELRERVAAS